MKLYIILITLITIFISPIIHQAFHPSNIISPATQCLQPPTEFPLRGAKHKKPLACLEINESEIKIQLCCYTLQTQTATGACDFNGYGPSVCDIRVGDLGACDSG